MNHSRDRRGELRTARIEGLTEHERGVVVLAGLGYAVAAVVLNVSLAVIAARAIRRGWRQRQLGPARAMAAGLAPASGWAVGLIGAQVAAGASAVWVVNRQLAAHAVPPRPPSGNLPTV